MVRTDKRTQIQRLKNEYLRLNQPMAECSLLDLVRRVEIEFSKNKQFEVQKGRIILHVLVRVSGFGAGGGGVGFWAKDVDVLGSGRLVFRGVSL